MSEHSPKALTAEERESFAELAELAREYGRDVASQNYTRVWDAYDALERDRAALLALVRRALPHLAFGVDESTPEVYALVRDMRAWAEAE